jgi:hypothetical protein
MIYCWCGQEATHYYERYDGDKLAVCPKHTQTLSTSLNYSNRAPNKGEERHDNVWKDELKE